MGIGTHAPPWADTQQREETLRIGGAQTRGLRIEVDGVSRHVNVRGRGRLTVLDNVSLEIGAGELIAIVGPSGAGKTMALETLAGVAQADAGAVRYDGVEVRANLRRLRGTIGYVPQDDIIHADL